MKKEGDKFDRWIATSLVLHAVLFAFVVFSPSLFPMQRDLNWGSPTGGDGGISVKIVGSISGVALPSPAVVDEQAAANESKGFYKTEDAAKPQPPEESELIPETKAPVKTTTPPKPARPAARETKTPPPESPANAVPYGQGGRPAMAYGAFSNGGASGGIGFGDGSFGDRYGWYVQAITRRISQNWLQSLVDTQIQRAPRVYLNFEIARDGTIGNDEVKQASGIPSLDRSAQRAINASNPLPPLPADYSGQRVTVNFYFDYMK